MIYQTQTDELLAKLLDTQLTLLEMAGKRSDEIAILNNGGLGTFVSLSSPYANKESYTIPSARCYLEGGQRVEFRIPRAGILANGFTVIPDIDCYFSYSTNIKV